MGPMAGPAEVESLAAAARASGRLGIDTEFMGEGRYQALLCLVQVVVEREGGVEVAVLDPLASGLDPAPLAAVLADPAIEVVLHAARQDIALLRREWRTEVRAIFDTQIAAGFAGLRAQMGYDALLTELLGLRLGKSASLTRWDQRPLSEEQLLYARDDVLHLLGATDALQARLGAQGRLEWAREECQALEEVSDERVPDALFARLPRVNGLDPRARAVARELVDWREQTAREADRPATSILQDAALVEIAKRRPQTTQALEQIRGVGEATMRRRGKAVVEAVIRGHARAPIAAEPGGGAPPDARDAPLVALAEALVRARTLESGLAYELVASRADLQRIVTFARTGGGEPDVRTLDGWRRELVGDELLALLGGRGAVGVQDGAVRVTADR